MKFEPNKYYKHTTGEMLHTFDFVDTTFYGRGLLAETSDCKFVPVGTDEESTVNYIEVSKSEWDRMIEMCK